MAPLVCAAVNLAAALALATVLAPGTPIVADIADRERYIGDHLALWRVGWVLWMAAAATLLWFYAWWRERVGGPWSALLIGGAGLCADWAAEATLILIGAGGYRQLAPGAFLLTGAVANGLYTVAGIQLTSATRLSMRARAYAALMWSAGVMLSVGALIGEPLVTAIASAELFALFVPWCLWLWRYLAVKARP